MTLLHRSLLTAIGALLFSQVQAEQNWNQFRGPTGRGHSEAADVPKEWNSSSVVWKTKLKGVGQSSVVNWGDKLFVTSAKTDGKERYVFCLDRKTGDLLWEKTITSRYPEKHHKMNTMATPTCAVNENVVCAFFGPAGLWCYDHDGNQLWEINFGAFPGDWGVASSPIIVGDNVIQNCDREGNSKIVAVTLDGGKLAWSTWRHSKPKGGWSTPILIKLEDQSEELVLNGEFGVRGYDVTSGKEKWFCKGFNGRGAPVPDYSKGKLFVVNGKPGDTYCVTPGGSGDVTKSHMIWHSSRKGGRDLPSPAVVGPYLFITSMSAVASCYDSQDGTLLWADRLEESSTGPVEIAGSPLVANGLVYVQNVFGGKTFVVQPGKKRNVVAVNDIGGESNEMFRSTLAPIQGQLFSRSYTIGEGEEESYSTVYCLQ